MYTEKDLTVGKTYLVKYEGEARATSREFQGFKKDWIENEAGDFVPSGKVIVHFNSQRGGNKWYYLDQIVSAVEVPLKVHKTYEKTCDRCFGAGHFEHLKHVERGTCFKCEGRGKI